MTDIAMNSHDPGVWPRKIKHEARRRLIKMRAQALGIARRGAGRHHRSIDPDLEDDRGYNMGSLIREADMNETIRRRKLGAQIGASWIGGAGVAF